MEKQPPQGSSLPASAMPLSDTVPEGFPPCIYRIFNTKTGKQYVGSAKNLRLRVINHRRLLRNGGHHSAHMQRSFVKHGEGVFYVQALAFCDSRDLLKFEQFYIDMLLPEFNMCPTAGSCLGRTLSEETKNKMREKAIGRKYGERSEEHRAALSRALKGKQKSPEHAAAFRMGRARVVYTEERRAALSRALKGAYENGKRDREKTESHRFKIGKTLAVLPDEVIHDIRDSVGVYSGAEMSRKYGIPASTVSQIRNRKRYKWVK